VSRVLLCVRGGALELPLVAGALRDRRAEPVVLDASAFPTGVSLSLAYDRDGFAARWAAGGGIEDARGIAAVWQANVVGSDLPAMEGGTRETCVAASERAVVGLLDGLQVFQLDPYWHQQRADNKPHQLCVAQRAGLDVPRTIITNEPEAVRELARRCGPVIAKMLVQPASTGPTRDADVPVVFTTALTAEDLAQLDGLDLCPMIFQERVEDAFDVRVTIVGKRVFGAALDATERTGGLDWRRQSHAMDRVPAWTPYELPDDVADRLMRVVDHFGLGYGAADLMVRPDGRHVFLELNASGAFAFLGAGIAGSIAEAIAEVLVDPAARRVAS